MQFIIRKNERKPIRCSRRMAQTDANHEGVGLASLTSQQTSRSGGKWVLSSEKIGVIVAVDKEKRRLQHLSFPELQSNAQNTLILQLIAARAAENETTYRRLSPSSLVISLLSSCYTSSRVWGYVSNTIWVCVHHCSGISWPQNQWSRCTAPLIKRRERIPGIAW